MKNTLLIAILLFSGTITAQQVKFGAKAGLNFASLSGKNVQGLDSRTGFHLGLVAEMVVSEQFSIQPEILYSGLGATASEDEGTYKLDYIAVPIMSRYYIVNGLSLEAGPQIAFNVIAENQRYGETYEINELDPFEFGVGFGAGYQFAVGLFFQVRYVLGITNALDYPGLKNNAFQLSGGYKF